MMQANNFSRSSKGILKISKHPPLSRSASLQTKRTCFKDDKCFREVGVLSKTFNFGCSLDEPELPSPSKETSERSGQHILCAAGDFITPEVIQEDEDVPEEHSEDFRERRKSFELRPAAKTFEGFVDLRAILAHKIPDLEPEEDEEEDTFTDNNMDQDKCNRRETAQSIFSSSSSKSTLEYLRSPDIEMSSSHDD